MLESTEIQIEEINCEDAGIKSQIDNLIKSNCAPSCGDTIELEGVLFNCTKKHIRMANGLAYLSIDLEKTS